MFNFQPSSLKIYVRVASVILNDVEISLISFRVKTLIYVVSKPLPVWTDFFQ